MLATTLLTIAFMLGSSACSSFASNNNMSDSTDSNKPFKTLGSDGNNSANLAIPPGLSAPQNNEIYKTVNDSTETNPAAVKTQGDIAAQNIQTANNSLVNSYVVNKVRHMKIVSSGSQRWLVVENSQVDTIWPHMLSFLNNLGLNVQTQNKAIGLIQSAWASKNNTVAQNDQGIRSLFAMIGLGSMYSLQTQYMFRVLLWQDGNNVAVFVTDYQMNEVYANCKMPRNSSLETSDKTDIKWMPMPPNPALELEFLSQFMVYSGIDSASAANTKNNPQGNVGAKAIINANSNNGQSDKNSLPNPTPSDKKAIIHNSTIILNNDFDEAWWQLAIALQRVGLGVADKNRSSGDYYVYSLQSDFSNPQQGFFSKWFGGKQSISVKMPEASYIVHVQNMQNMQSSSNDASKKNDDAKNAVNITMQATKENHDKQSSQKIADYLQQLLLQLE